MSIWTRKWMVCLLFLPFWSCQCSDEAFYEWTFYEPYEADGSFVADVVDDAGGPEIDLGDLEPDIAFVPDVRPPDDVGEPEDTWVDPGLDWDEGTWTTEVVDDGFPANHALNDRTSLVVDPQGTMWLGYHSCANIGCVSPRLTVGQKRVGGEWSFEDIQPHSGLFGLEVIQSQEPIAIYLDDADNSLKAAMRHGVNDWAIERLNVQRGDRSDGFDVTHDRTRFYVSFASRTSSTVDFLVYNISASAPQWRRLPSLSQAYSAARERGLRADNDFSLYLVHRESDWGAYGVAHYSLVDNQWRQRTYLSTSEEVSAFVIRRSGELCLSSDHSTRLVVTCGDMSSLARERHTFPNETTGFLSSMVEGRNGTLFVAFHNNSTGHLRVARRAPGESWTVETAFEGSSYGVSTAINHNDQLAVSFYNCEGQGCTLQVLQKTY